MANRQNTDSRADGRKGKVRSTAVPEQRWRGGEQWAVGEGWPCQEPVWWSRPGGERFGESLMRMAP